MNRWLLGLIFLCIALLSFFFCPGHAWLALDTQIYVPILEHLQNPAVLQKDILVQDPHVSFTLYDELVLGLHRISGLSFHAVLDALQVITRALFVWGVYLIALAAGLRRGYAVLVAGILAMGTVIIGPLIFLVELETVPRAIAIPLLFLAIGLTAHQRYLAAGIAAAGAFLMHPPAVYPFWAVYFCLLLVRDTREVRLRRLWALVPMVIAFIILLVAAHRQAGQGEMQEFFGVLDPLLEKLQRMRSSYLWISTWWRFGVPFYSALFAVTLGAYWRIRDQVSRELRFFLIGLPLVGVLSMPVSYLLLEKMKWALVPQIQPMRAVLFVTAMAIFSVAVAGCRAAQQDRPWEAFAWFLLVYWLPGMYCMSAFTSPRWKILVLPVLLSIITSLALWMARRRERWASAILVAAALAPFLMVRVFLGPTPQYRPPEVDPLITWARTSTPPDSVFWFPDSGRRLFSVTGIFRAEAQRAIYVDWKGGGQANYLKHLGAIWWTRWQDAMEKPLTPEEYRKLGIDYLVFAPEHRLAGLQPVFENGKFVVYRLN